MTLKRSLLQVFSGIFLFTACHCSEQIWINTSNVSLALALDEEESFLDAIENIGTLLAASLDEQPSSLLLQSSSQNIKEKSPQKIIIRNYDIQPTEKEKKAISFIVNTLANKSLMKIWKEKSALKKAGEKIHHLHPFRFLQHIFSEEDLKNDLKTIYKRNWVAGEFKKGIYESLADERGKQNLTHEHIHDFAATLGINSDLIKPSIARGDWDDFVSTLIKHLSY